MAAGVRQTITREVDQGSSCVAPRLHRSAGSRVKCNPAEHLEYLRHASHLLPLSRPALPACMACLPKGATSESSLRRQAVIASRAPRRRATSSRFSGQAHKLQSTAPPTPSTARVNAWCLYGRQRGWLRLICCYSVAAVLSFIKQPSCGLRIRTCSDPRLFNSVALQEAAGQGGGKGEGQREGGAEGQPGPHLWNICDLLKRRAGSASRHRRAGGPEQSWPWPGRRRRHRPT